MNEETRKHLPKQKIAKLFGVNKTHDNFLKTRIFTDTTSLLLWVRVRTAYIIPFSNPTFEWDIS